MQNLPESKFEQKRLQTLYRQHNISLPGNLLVAICAQCKKVRDDKGYWNQIEAYIHEHSDADFSHSICPDCAKKLYPDMDLYDENK